MTATTVPFGFDYLAAFDAAKDALRRTLGDLGPRTRAILNAGAGDYQMVFAAAAEESPDTMVASIEATNADERAEWAYWGARFLRPGPLRDRLLTVIARSPSPMVKWWALTTIDGISPEIAALFQKEAR